MSFNIGNRHFGFMKKLLTIFTIPLKSIQFARTALTLDDETNGIGRPAGAMRNPGGKQEKFPFFQRQLIPPEFSIGIRFHEFQDDVAFQLIEKLFAFVHMKILPCIGSAHHHHNKIIRFLKQDTISNRRFEQIAVGLNPFF